VFQKEPAAVSPCPPSPHDLVASAEANNCCRCRELDGIFLISHSRSDAGNQAARPFLASASKVAMRGHGGRGADFRFVITQRGPRQFD
jgi:hypothetical protein